MTEFKMAYAKTHLASLIREAIAGEEVIIARDDQPLVRLVPLEIDETANERVPGDLLGKLTLPDEFFRPLTEDQTKEWEGVVRLLLDTHAYFWWRADPARLSVSASEAIRDRANVLYISAATVWELSIKGHVKGWEAARVLLLDIEEHLRAQSMLELPILLSHAREAGSLPLVHRDPFDRMLIAQARVERIQIVSNETLFDEYGVSRRW